MLKRYVEGQASIRIRHLLDGVDIGETPEEGGLLLESGDALLLETGHERLLLE